MGHAKALIGIEDAGRQIELARLAAEKGLSVREVERLAARLKEDEAGKDHPPSRHQRGELDHYYREMQLAMNNELGRKVKINLKNGDKGVLEIAFYSKEDLQSLAGLLGGLTDKSE